MSLRCLIVDDSPSVLAVVRGLLEREGIVIVATAQSIAEALEAAAQHRPDVALVDIDLGGESGFELTRRLAPDITVILISTHAERDFADLIEASAAIGFIPKSELSAAAVREILNAPRDT